MSGLPIRAFFLSLALAFASLASQAAADPTLVSTESGLVRGVEAAGVVSFKGIPYAAPPVGNLRWRVPRPVRHWMGVLYAQAFGPACMQSDDIPKSEDCLTLNVWRPATVSAAPLPVMVWIYGGALVHGNTALYPGDALAAAGVVVVSMNYRMGRLGFFAHPALAQEAPDDPCCNYGYMDQLAALQWVRRNIAAFGGDPNAVTIFGESAGGGSVLAHMVSPLSRGLFHAAILQSPGLPSPREGVSPLTSRRDAEQRAIAYAHSLGIMNDGAEGLAALRALPATELIEGASVPEVIAGLSSGTPVVGISGSILDGRFLAETPDAAFAAGRQAMVPVIVGANDRDLALGEADSKKALFASFGANADEARALYDPKNTVPLGELKQEVFADKTMVEPSRHLADVAARAGEPTWWYRFSYVAESSRATLKGARHGFEIPYTLNLPDALVREKVTEADKTMGAMASGYWVAFAKTGDPNGAGRPQWPRHDPSQDRLLEFTNDGVVVGPDPLRARLDLWQKLWNEAPLDGMR